jgi:glyoxylase-like metal-dependent hydrolase (beta-lactamase superfamily II)
VSADRANDFVYYPITFIATAYRPTTQVSEEGAGPNLRKVNIDAGGNKAAMLVDTRTNLPVRIEKVVYQPMLGDVTLATEFSDWQDVSGGGLKLPTRIVQRLANRWTLSEYQVANARVNEDVGNIGMTDSVRALTPLLTPAVTVAVEEMAPGVWWIGGGTHHTIAIEQSRSIVLVEAPQSDERTLAVIAKARELRPGKPVEIVINTHHHFDHAGGVRAAISQGLTIVTHEGNRDFYVRAVFPGRHVSQQDALAKNPTPLKITPVRDKRIMSDSLRTIEIYEATGNPHAGTMLVVYLPAEKILIQADMYNPPAANAPPPPGFPFAANLLDNIKRRGLVVERVVGIHGRPVPLAELQAAAAGTRAP